MNNIYTGDLKTYEYYIHCKDDGGNYIYSRKITIDVKYNCRFDEIKISPYPLQRVENSPAELYFESKNAYNIKPNLYLNLTTNTNKPFNFDITRRFINNAS